MLINLSNNLLILTKIIKVVKKNKPKNQEINKA